MCVLCDATENLEVHHVTPFRYAMTVLKWPMSLVNAPTNAVTLCRQCHSGNNESIHPDMALAHRGYKEDKTIYSKVFAERDMLCIDRKPYWWAGHDDWFRELALERTMKHLLNTGIPWPA